MQAIGKLPGPEDKYMEQDLSEALITPSDVRAGCHMFGIQMLENCNIPIVSQAKLSRPAVERLYPLLLLIAAHMGLDPDVPEQQETIDMLLPYRAACA